MAGIPTLQCYACLTDSNLIFDENQALEFTGFKINMFQAGRMKIDACETFYSTPKGMMSINAKCGRKDDDTAWDTNKIGPPRKFTPNHLSLKWELQTFDIDFTTSSIIPANGWIIFKSSVDTPKVTNFIWNINGGLPTTIEGSKTTSVLTCKRSSIEYKCQNIGPALVEGSYKIRFPSVSLDK